MSASSPSCHAMTGMLMRVRVSMTRGAQRWRSSTSRAARMRMRIASCQRSGSVGSSRSSAAATISPTTTSTTPSRTASLLSTWWYSDIASTPSSSARRRIVSAARPSRSARATAARRTRSRLKGARTGAGSVWDDIGTTVTDPAPTVRRSGPGPGHAHPPDCGRVPPRTAAGGTCRQGLPPAARVGAQGPDEPGRRGASSRGGPVDRIRPGRCRRARRGAPRGTSPPGRRGRPARRPRAGPGPAGRPPRAPRPSRSRR